MKERTKERKKLKRRLTNSKTAMTEDWQTQREHYKTHTNTKIMSFTLQKAIVQNFPQ